MADGGTHRIGSAALTFWAPRAAPQVQAVADRAARAARTRLAGAIAARIPADTRHMVIDRLDLEPTAIPPGTDPVEALSAAIAARMGRLRPGRGVWVFESEVAYIAAFVAACANGRVPAGRQWIGLGAVIGEPPVRTVLRLCQARRLDPLSVLAELSARGALARVLATASPDVLAELERRCAAQAPHPDAGSEVLLAAARSVLASIGVTAPVAETLKAALRALPVDWSSPTSLADAVGRAVNAGGWPTCAAEVWTMTARAVDHPLRDTPASNLWREPARLPAQTVAAIQTLTWLDMARLRQVLSVAQPPQASSDLTRAIRLLEQALSEVAEDIVGSRSDRAARLLWRAACRKLGGAGSDGILTGLIARVAEPGNVVPPDLVPLRSRWEALRDRAPPHSGDMSGAVLPATGQGHPPPLPKTAPLPPAVSSQTSPARPETAPADTAPTGADTHRSPSTRIETEAAGLFLLWRTLIDLSFTARARAVSDAEDFASRALWTIWRDETGLPLDEAAGLLFAGLPPETRPDPISDTEAQRLTANLARAPGLAHSRSAAAGLNATLIAGMTCWLRGFETSSTAFMRRSFLHRPGALLIGKTRLEVRLSALPFDLVLRRAGYLDPLSAPDLLGGYRTRFSIEDSP